MEGPVTTTDEATWIARARSGDAAAFEALLTRYERQIYAYIYRMMGGNGGRRGGPDAGYLPQGVSRAGSDVGRPQCLGMVAPDRLELAAWMNCGGGNGFAGSRGTSRSMTGCCTAARGRTPNARRFAGKRKGRCRRSSIACPPRNKQALVLREYEGLSCEDIGEMMGISRSAVKSVLFRAREEFRKYSVELGFDAPLEDEDS